MSNGPRKVGKRVNQGGRYPPQEPPLQDEPQEIAGGRMEEDKVDDNDNDNDGNAPTEQLGTEYARTFAMVGG